MSTRAMPSAERPREIATQVADLAREMLGGSVRVYWFGSWVEGGAVDRSDVDVGVVADEPIALTALSRLRGAVEDLPTLFAIDLVDLGSVDPAFRRRVMDRGVRV